MVIVFLEIAIYAYVWYGYYNPLLKNPFWRRGNWLIIVLYGVLLLFFLKTYGGLKIGFLKKGNLIYSQILSVVFVNIVTYIQIALIDKKFHNVLMILVVTLLDVVVIVAWTFVFQWIYGRISRRGGCSMCMETDPPAISEIRSTPARTSIRSAEIWITGAGWSGFLRKSINMTR